MTEVFEKNRLAKKRIVVNEGGSGSSKTYSIAQLFVTKACEMTGKTFTIVRKTLPELKASAMKDFFSILKEQGIYTRYKHNKSDNTYSLHGNLIEFIGLDDPQKVRSRRRNYLWMNEGTELSLESFRQLSMRTEDQIFIDYNPSFQFHWIYDEVLPRPDCELIHSTYLDNPFLTEEIVKEIEGYRFADQNYWRIYGLGLRGVAESLIVTHWQYCDEMPEQYDLEGFGIDFGFNNPSAITRVVIKDQDAYWDELLYESHLTNPDLMDKMKVLGISGYIYPDIAEPARIEEFRRNQFNVHDTDKEVKAGLDSIKSRKLFITKRSVNLIKELRSYSWKTKDGKILDEPVKENDHLIDAGRYAQYAMTSRSKVGFERM